MLERPADALEPSATLLNEYSCDGMEVSECLQIAEEIWSASLMPNPMKESDHADMMKRFATLQAVIEKAERRTKKSG